MHNNSKNETIHVMQLTTEGDILSQSYSQGFRIIIKWNKTINFLKIFSN